MPRTYARYHNVVTLIKGHELRKYLFLVPSNLYETATVHKVTQRPGIFNPDLANEILMMNDTKECPAAVIGKSATGNQHYPKGFGSHLMTDSPNWELVIYYFARARTIQIDGATVPAMKEFHRQLSEEIDNGERRLVWCYA